MVWKHSNERCLPHIFGPLRSPFLFILWELLIMKCGNLQPGPLGDRQPARESGLGFSYDWVHFGGKTLHFTTSAFSLWPGLLDQTYKLQKKYDSPSSKLLKSLLSLFFLTPLLTCRGNQYIWCVKSLSEFKSVQSTLAMVEDWAYTPLSEFPLRKQHKYCH